MKKGKPKFNPMKREFKGLSTPDIYLEIIDEKNERIRKLEIAILTLAEADPEKYNIQNLAKQAVVSYNIKCGWNNKKKGGDINVGT